MVRGLVCAVLVCFSSVLPPLKVFSCSAKPSVMSKVPQPVQKTPLNWMISKGEVREMNLAVVLGLWVRL